MNEPNWAKLLSMIYSKESSVPALITEGHIFVENTDLDVDDVQDSIKILFRHELIEKSPTTARALVAKENSGSIPDKDASLILSEKGFDVAHKREQNKNSTEINDSIRRLTLILAIAALIQALSAVAQVGKPESFAILGGSILLVIIGVFAIEYNWY